MFQTLARVYFLIESISFVLNLCKCIIEVDSFNLNFKTQKMEGCRDAILNFSE